MGLKYSAFDIIYKVSYLLFIIILMKKSLIGISVFFFVFSTALALTTPSILPSADGTYTSWTPSTGASHFALVDEATCNGNTDRNSTNTVGNRDSYVTSLSSVPNGSQITAISITPCASRNQNGGGSSTMNVFHRINGMNSSDSGSYALTGTTPANLSATVFSGLSTIKTSTTTLEVGAVYSAGTRGAKLSRISTVVTYTSLATTTLSASAVSTSQINLSWADTNSIEDGYVVERSSVSSTGPFSHLATTSADSISLSDTGLSSNTSYWYRIKAYNQGGETIYSNTATAITLQNPPTVTTDFAIATTSYAALLNGTTNPNGVSTTGWFRYSTSTPGTCNDSFGSRAPFFGSVSLGSGSSSVGYSSMAYLLSPSTTYYYCAISSSSAGTGFGSIETFTTTP